MLFSPADSFLHRHASRQIPPPRGLHAFQRTDYRLPKIFFAAADAAELIDIVIFSGRCSSSLLSLMFRDALLFRRLALLISRFRRLPSWRGCFARYAAWLLHFGILR